MWLIFKYTIKSKIFGMIYKSYFHDWLLVFRDPLPALQFIRTANCLILCPHKHTSFHDLLSLVYHLPVNPFPSWLPGLIPTYSSSQVQLRRHYVYEDTLNLPAPGHMCSMALYIEIAVVLVLFPSGLRTCWWQEPTSTNRMPAELAMLSITVLTWTASMLAT